MERIPPQMWGMVFGNLGNSHDFQNPYNTCQLWKDVLQSSKASWMFGLAFPHFEQYLSPTESLMCRTICQLWYHGVNNYLENNPYFRPTFEEPGALENTCRTDFRLTPETDLFSQLVNSCNGHREDMIQHVPNYSSSLPLVGKWFYIEVSPMEPLSQFHKEFLNSFGSHIWFLYFSIRGDPSSLDALNILLEYLPLFPNLKRLELDPDYENSSPPSTQETRQQLKKYLETPAAMERIKKLPKCLETLEMGYEIDCPEDLKEVVTELMCSEANLQSVSLGGMSDVACLVTGNIIDLSVKLTTYSAVHQMLRIRSPVRRLKLGCDVDAVPPEALLRVAKHFRESLRNFHVVLDYSYLRLEEKEPKSFEKLCFSLEYLTDRHTLEDLKNVKRMTVQGSCLLSFNLLCGLSSSLEYLHILIEIDTGEEVDEDGIILAPFHQRMQFTEEMDLLEELRRFAKLKDGKRFYKSTVWTAFPKLRELTVQISGDPEHLGDADTHLFRRDIYDKLGNN